MKVQSVRNDQAYDGYTVLALCVSTVYPRLVFENTKRRILRKLVVNDERKCERRRKKKEKKKERIASQWWDDIYTHGLTGVALNTNRTE